MAKAFRDTPWPVLLLIVSFLCPTELSLYLGPVRLPPHRALLLALLPVALFRQLGPRGSRICAFDIAFLLFAVWTLLVFIMHHGMDSGLQTGGSLALDGFGSFLVARAFVRDPRSLAATAGVLFAAVAVSVVIALPEMLTSKFYVHDLMHALTGYHHPTAAERRLGLTRAFATFDHPIHLGTFSAAGLALSLYAARHMRRQWLRAIVIPLGALASLSSAPMLSIAAQVGLMTVERMTRGMKGRLWVGIAIVGVAFLAVSVIATRSPFAVIATGFTLDSWTGYYRLMIWESGLANVATSPIFGIGLNDWVRPVWMYSPTIDAFWLVVTLRTGIPAIVILLGAIALLSLGVGRRQRQATREARALGIGWLISLLALMLVGCTVHFWNVPYAFFFFFLGLGGCLADPLRAAARQGRAKQAAAPVATVAWIPPHAVAATLPMAAPPAWAPGPPSWPVPVPAPARGRARTTPRRGSVSPLPPPKRPSRAAVG